MRLLALAVSGILSFAPAAHAAAVADPAADISVSMPAFPKDKGPRIAVDAGHQNFHTIDGRFKPFGQLLTSDGFRVQTHEGPFLPEALARYKILVVANALNQANVDKWSLPTPSAFTQDEISGVKSFVEKGGSLLLIADHMPFSGAAADLAAAFGITFLNGFAFHMPEPRPVDMFAAEDSSLHDDPILRGRSSSEAVSRVATFTGSAFRAPDTARPLLVLTGAYEVFMPQTAWVFTPQTPRTSGRGLLQGAVMPVGRGRVAVFGEAAMFSAQIEESNGAKIGFSAPGAEPNKQFVLNVVRWLAGVLGP